MIHFVESSMILHIPTFNVLTDHMHGSSRYFLSPSGSVQPSDENEEPSELYIEYQKMCFDILSGYRLGEPVTKLSVFHKLVETKFELLGLEM